MDMDNRNLLSQRQANFEISFQRNFVIVSHIGALWRQLNTGGILYAEVPVAYSAFTLTTDSVSCLIEQSWIPVTAQHCRAAVQVQGRTVLFSTCAVWL
jgi:uncharacterized protein (DUF2235 family)